VPASLVSCAHERDLALQTGSHRNYNIRPAKRAPKLASDHGRVKREIRSATRRLVVLETSARRAAQPRLPCPALTYFEKDRAET
jgi:hypothetical protein